jgi:hypothetical protein
MVQVVVEELIVLPVAVQVATVQEAAQVEQLFAVLGRLARLILVAAVEAAATL